MLDPKQRILGGKGSGLRHVEESRRNTDGSQRASELQKYHREARLTRQPRLPGGGARRARDQARVAELLLVANRLRMGLHRIPSCH